MVACWAISPLFGQDSSSIAGSVVDGSGTAVAGAVVGYEHLPPEMVGPGGAITFTGPRVNLAVKADSSGSLARLMLDTTLTAQGVPAAPVAVSGPSSIGISVR
jgi:hypothetical protein